MQEKIEILKYQYKTLCVLASLVHRQVIDAGFKLLDPAPSPEVRALRKVEASLVKTAGKMLQEARELEDQGFVYEVFP